MPLNTFKAVKNEPLTSLIVSIFLLLGIVCAICSELRFLKKDVEAWQNALACLVEKKGNSEDYEQVREVRIFVGESVENKQ